MRRPARHPYGGQTISGEVFLAIWRSYLVFLKIQRSHLIGDNQMSHVSEGLKRGGRFEKTGCQKEESVATAETDPSF